MSDKALQEFRRLAGVKTVTEGVNDTALMPSLSINGTDPDDLEKTLKEAQKSLLNTLNAVQKAAPHPRDYDLHVWPQVKKRWDEFVDSIIDFQNYVQDIRIAVSDYSDLRKQTRGH